MRELYGCFHYSAIPVAPAPHTCKYFLNSCGVHTMCHDAMRYSVTKQSAAKLDSVTISSSHRIYHKTGVDILQITSKRHPIARP